jgi:flagellar biosynthesis protein FliR
MTTIDPTSPAMLQLTGRLAARYGGLMLIAPVFSARTFPIMVRTALLVVLTMLTLPAAFTAATEPVHFTPVTLLAETLVGLTLGFAAALVVAGAEIAGDLLGTQSGLAGATTLDPLGQSGNTQVLGHFAKLLVVTLILALDGHIVMLEALNASVVLLPVGSAVAMADGAHALVLLAGEMFVLGVRFAAPVTAAVFVGNVALGVMAKATPQLNIFMVAYPVQIGIGLLVFGLALPLIGAGFANWPGEYASTVYRLLDVLGARS